MATLVLVDCSIVCLAISAMERNSRANRLWVSSLGCHWGIFIPDTTPSWEAGVPRPLFSQHSFSFATNENAMQLASFEHLARQSSGLRALTFDRSSPTRIPFSMRVYGNFSAAAVCEQIKRMARATSLRTQSLRTDVANQRAVSSYLCRSRIHALRRKFQPERVHSLNGPFTLNVEKTPGSTLTCSIETPQLQERWR